MAMSDDMKYARLGIYVVTLLCILAKIGNMNKLAWLLWAKEAAGIYDKALKYQNNLIKCKENGFLLWHTI